MRNRLKTRFVVIFILGMAFIPATTSKLYGQFGEQIGKVAGLLASGGTSLIADLAKAIEDCQAAYDDLNKAIDKIVSYLDLCRSDMTREITNAENDSRQAMADINGAKNGADRIVAEWRGSNMSITEALRLGDDRVTLLLTTANSVTVPRYSTEIASIKKSRDDFIAARGQQLGIELQEIKTKMTGQRLLLASIVDGNFYDYDAALNTLSSIESGLNVLHADVLNLGSVLAGDLSNAYNRILNALRTCSLGKLKTFALIGGKIVKMMEDIVINQKKPGSYIDVLKNYCNFGFINGDVLVRISEAPLPSVNPATRDANKEHYQDTSIVAKINQIRAKISAIKSKLVSDFSLSSQAMNEFKTPMTGLFGGKPAAESNRAKTEIMNGVRGGKLSKYPWMITKIDRFLSAQATQFGSQKPATTPSIIKR